MKSNKWRKIIIKNPKLQQIRKNLRTILTLAVEKRHSEIHDENQVILERIKAEYIRRGGKIEDQVENYIPETHEVVPASRSGPTYRKSILICSTGTPCYSATENQSFYDTSLDIDMVWNPIDRNWICINCYNEIFGTVRLKNAYRRYIDKERRIVDEIMEGVKKGL